MRLNMTGDVFTLYDELMELYSRLGHKEFLQVSGQKCKEFSEKNPGSGGILVRMQMHIEAKRSGKTA